MNIQQLLTCSEAVALMPPSYEEVDWDLREDFPNLALIGPRIYRSNGQSHVSHVFVVWDEYMLQKTQVFEKTCLLKDFGEGKRKMGLGVLPLDNIPTFENHHKIQIRLHRV